jgi:hypothetical protein
MAEDLKLTPEEVTALRAIDGSYHQRRPAPELEATLRKLGLIEPSQLSRQPRRTARGEAVVRSLFAK